MSNPDSLSPNRLNQALISETLSEFPHFEFVSTNTPDEAASSHPEVNGQAQQDPVVYGIEMDQGKFKTQNSNIYSKLFLDRKMVFLLQVWAEEITTTLFRPRLKTRHQPAALSKAHLQSCGEEIAGDGPTSRVATTCRGKFNYSYHKTFLRC